MKVRSDRERILDKLRLVNGVGLTTFEIRRSGLSGNPSQRINELRDEGHTIEAHPHREGRRQGKRYVLVNG